MALTEKDYSERLIDKKIADYLKVFGAVSIEGPKWCGKTWTSLNHANSVIYMDEEENQERAKLDIKSIFTDDENLKPQLIDEWHIIPKLWDATRRQCDKSHSSGNYILTGSTTLSKKDKKKKIYHSGAGRIGIINMYTMSLYESGDSSGKASIMDMFNNRQESMYTNEVKLETIANLIIRGGWPRNIKYSGYEATIIPKSYIDSIINTEINDEDNKKRDKNKMRMLLRSLARNECTIVNNSSILKDIEDYETEKELLSGKNTLVEYLDILDRLYLIENQPPYSENYRSKERVGKSAKRHFTDPSLACACLNLNADKLIGDLKTFGFLFEALVERDLRIYMDYLDGNLYHFRDNVSGLEVDSILEFADGEYAAVEIKLGFNQVTDAIKNLVNFKKHMLKEPKFMCVIVGMCTGIAKDPETGIYIVPITALKP